MLPTEGSRQNRPKLAGLHSPPAWRLSRLIAEGLTFLAILRPSQRPSSSQHRAYKMRLLNTSTRHIKEFQSDDIPPYAILSHTWGSEEVSFQEMAGLSSGHLWKAGFDKIAKTCEVDVGEKYEWVWIDTCCIDKSSSAELTEAINSMYNWYARAQVCYVYLEDFGADSSLDELPGCRWFTRGWTLQELIAPRHMQFFDKEWAYRGAKAGLVERLSSITGISEGILLHSQALSTVSVAQKMSWASGRNTTRIEDTAYCMMGIFGVHLSLRYGEEHRAFRRLQEAIISSVLDLSVFAWRRQAPATAPTDDRPRREYCGVLATEPRDYAESGSFSKRKPFARHELLSMNGAIMAKIQLFVETTQKAGYRYLLPLDCCYDSRPEVTLCVRLRKCGYNEFVREDPYGVVEFLRPLLSPIILANRYLLPDTTTQEWGSADPSNTPESAMNMDLVGQNRSRAIQLELPVGMWLHTIDVWPGYRFDGEDRAFYLTGPNFAHDASIQRLRGGVLSSFGEHIKVNFECVFCTLGWSSTDEDNPPQCTLLDYSKVASVLTELRTEVCGWDFHRNYVLERLVFHGMPRTSSVVVQGKWSRVRVSFKVELVTDGNVCRGKFWRVVFSFESCGDESDGQESSEEWVFDTA